MARSDQLLRQLIAVLDGRVDGSPEYIAARIAGLVREGKAMLEPTIVDWCANRQRNAVKSHIQKTIEVDGAGKVPIYLGGDGMFYAHVGDVSERRGVEADTLDGCARKAKIAWKANVRIVWARAIHIHFENDGPRRRHGETCSGVHMTAQRFWHGMRADGSYICAAYSKETWEDPAAPQTMAYERTVVQYGWFTKALPYIRNHPHGGMEVDIAYDDATWATVEDIARRLDELARKLGDLFKRPETLVLVGAPQLLLPSEG